LSKSIDTGTSWVTGAKYMPTFKCLAVTTFSRSLTMYDIASPFLTVCGSIPKMEFTPLTLDVWAPPGVRGSEFMAIGDAGGQVHVHAITPHARQDHFQELSEMDSKKGRPKAVDKVQEELLWSKLVHSKWVSKVMYISDLQQLISCSLDGMLWAMDVERRCEAPGSTATGRSAGDCCLLIGAARVGLPARSTPSLRSCTRSCARAAAVSPSLPSPLGVRATAALRGRARPQVAGREDGG